MKLISRVLFALAWAVGHAAVAADLTDGIADSAREARRQARDERVWLRLADVDRPKTGVSLGVAHDDEETGTKTLTTPFRLYYQTAAARWWRFQVSGDGYARVTPSGEPVAEGLADLGLSVTHTFGAGAIASLGVRVPTAGEVGSSSGAQSLKLAKSGGFGNRWGYLALVSLSRANKTPTGVSRYGQAVYGEVSYTAQDKATTLLAGLTRSHKRGAGSATDLSLGLDMELGEFTASVSVVRGISQGARHTGVGFDIIRVF